MRVIASLIIGFVIGFYVNALLMYEAPSQLVELAQLPQNLSANASQEESRWTEIIFNGTQFVPSKLELGWGKAFYIKNEAKDTSIELYSVPDGLVPQHRIPYLELYTTVATTPGTYSVYVKGVPSAKLTLTIGPKAPVAK